MEVMEVLLLACEVIQITTKALFWGGQALAGWLRRQSEIQRERDCLRKAFAREETI
jgi:hypothetical protein